MPTDEELAEQSRLTAEAQRQTHADLRAGHAIQVGDIIVDLRRLTVTVNTDELASYGIPADAHAAILNAHRRYIERTGHIPPATLAPL